MTTYTHGSFTDLCRGPHVENTGNIGAFKLLKVAGAYWRGYEKRPMLQRIYGTAFSTKAELDHYLKMLEEAAMRDHRKVGSDLDLFSTMDEFGAGLILWHPKGSRIRNTIETFWRDEHYKNGYELLYTPHIGRSTLWRAPISGQSAVWFARKRKISWTLTVWVPREYRRSRKYSVITE